jgi:hypothetical protein
MRRTNNSSLGLANNCIFTYHIVTPPSKLISAIVLCSNLLAACVKPAVQGSSEQLQIIPNPCTDLVKLDLQQTAKCAKYAVLDLQGKVVYTGVIRQQISLSMGPHAAGTYIAKIEHANGEQVVKKFVKAY